VSRVLILFATTEGHTARIADRIARRLQGRGYTIELLRADSIPSGFNPTACDDVIIGASIHYGHHPNYLRAFIRRHRAALALRPGAFFSVSLSAGGPGAKPEAAQRYLDAFLRQTGWRPRQTASFAGALQYSRYGVFKKLMMRLIVGMAGGDTDPTRDYEYTDWDAVDRFTDVFVRRFEQV
jgi:menaquinone-dependent protoporphyrinogen oxidase